jgi:acetyl esterase/lipase
MTWYRNLYFSKPEEAQTWDASPLFAPEGVMALCPATFLAIAECDLLLPEALQYSKKLTEAGVDVHSKVYPGATHSVLILAG